MAPNGSSNTMSKSKYRLLSTQFATKFYFISMEANY